jgi:hypothetical protein
MRGDGGVSKPFPDRRWRLFARDGDIDKLVARAYEPGLTAVFAPARMGKTWIMEEVARRLSAPEQGFVVGYHEAMGGSSHLLYTVSDLYTRWLPNSSYLDQARTLWDLHQNELVPMLGKVAAGAIGPDTVVRDLLLYRALEPSGHSNRQRHSACGCGSSSSAAIR